MSNVIKNTFVLGVLLFAFAVLALMWDDARQTEASVAYTNEYLATTTYAADTNPEKVVKRGQGSLGSVVITGANTGLTAIYDATTTNQSFRSASKSTTTQLIAQFPASAAAGTYTFDVQFTDGLIIVSSGAEATSTITYR